MNGSGTNRTGGWSLGTILRELSTTFRLLRDPAVPKALKILLPVAATVYWISPVDLMPLLPFDDAALMVVALYLFNQIAPTFTQQPGTQGHGQSDDQYSDGPTVDTTWRVVED